MSSFGSTTEDIDGVPIDRGPPEEDRKTEAELRGQMRDIASAKLSMGEIATVEGIMAEMKMMQSQMDDLMEQNNRLINLYETLRGEFEQYRNQRATELQSWVAGGSTSPEDA